MTLESETTVNETVENEAVKTIQFSAVENFWIGFGLSAICVAAVVLGSTTMSHIALADIAITKLVAASAIPFASGILAVRFKQKFTEILSAMMDSLSLTMPG